MNLPDDPWQLLGLDPATATERDVKRAYARLLKVHRPDTDPEGFQKLHAAYQEALEQLERLKLEAGAVDEPSSPDQTPHSPPHSEEPVPVLLPLNLPDESSGEETVLPEEFTAAARELEEEGVPTVGSNCVYRPAPSLKFQRLRQIVRQRPELGPAWAEFLSALYPSPSIPARFLEPQDLLMLLDSRADWYVMQTVDAWQNIEEDHVLVHDFFTLLAARSPAPDLTGILYALSSSTAFVLPACSSLLLDALFELLPGPQRSSLIREIEKRQAAGRLFAGVPLLERRFWDRRLFDSSPDDASWESPDAVTALASLAAVYPSYWDGWNLVNRVFPKEVIEREVPPQSVSPAYILAILRCIDRILNWRVPKMGIAAILLLGAIAGSIATCESSRQNSSPAPLPQAQTRGHKPTPATSRSDLTKPAKPDQEESKRTPAAR